MIDLPARDGNGPSGDVPQPDAQKLDRMKLSIGGKIRDFYFRPDTSDVRVIEQVFHQKAYDLSRLRRFGELIEYARAFGARARHPLIVDAGANIGASALYFSAHFPGAVVVAIEPEPRNYQLLVENTRGLNVVPVLGAVAATNKQLRIVDVGEGYWGYQTRPPEGFEGDLVRTITLNEIYHFYGEGGFPFLVKIDIEGDEKDLFSSNLEWVKYTPLIIAELHDWLLPNDGVALPFLKCIAKLDRDFITFGEDAYSIAKNLEASAEKEAVRCRTISNKRALNMGKRKLDSTSSEAGGGLHEEGRALSTSTLGRAIPLMSSDVGRDAILHAKNFFLAEIEIIQNSEKETREALADARQKVEVLQRELQSERQGREALHIERRARQELEARFALEFGAAAEKERALLIQEQRLRSHVDALVEREHVLNVELIQARKVEADLQHRVHTLVGELDELRGIHRNRENELVSELTELRHRENELVAERTKFQQSELVFASLKIGNALNHYVPWALRAGKFSARTLWRVYRRLRKR